METLQNILLLVIGLRNVSVPFRGLVLWKPAEQIFELLTGDVSVPFRGLVLWKLIKVFLNQRSREGFSPLSGISAVETLVMVRSRTDSAMFQSPFGD